MTIKELRIENGMNQTECARILGVSLRTYQNYENDKNKEGTAKYNAFLKILQGYGIKDDDRFQNSLFYTNVVIENGVSALYNKVCNFKKREVFSHLERYINGKYSGKICVLYGLRRTGKTTMLFQMLGELPKDKVAYIKIQINDNMANLTKDLHLLFERGYQYVFIDEITLLEDFINTAAILSDIYSSMGMKIVVSGADSLGFAMAARDELYDRCIMIHTSFIPFREYEKLLNINSVDKYIEYGGTLKMENMSFDDPDSAFDDVSFRDDESTRKYIDTAISRNIQHTLKNDSYGDYFNELKELYNKGELTNIINRIVENMNHDFLLKVVEDSFKSHDLGSAKDLLLHEVPNESAYILYDIDAKNVVERLKQIIEVKEKEETSFKITQEHIEKVKKYLVMLDLIVNCPDVYESGKQGEHFVFTQPGMRYSIAKALVYSLVQDEYFKSCSEQNKKHIVEKILENVKGRMLEEIVILETIKAMAKNKKVFKYKFDGGGEYDMVVYDSVKNTCCLYEVKHSDKIVENQTRFLKDEKKCKSIENIYGSIAGKYVLYRGKTCTIEDVYYKNVEEYLSELI